MADDQVLEELAGFLSPTSRPDVKASALQYVLGMTSSADGTRLLLAHAKVRRSLVTLAGSQEEETASADAFRALINLTASVSDDNDDNGKDDVAGESPLASDGDLLTLLLTTVLDESSPNADHACKALTNLTRLPGGCRKVMEVLSSDAGPASMARLVTAFCRRDYSKRGQALDYLGTVLANLTQLPAARRFVLDRERCVLQRLLPYTQYAPSRVRRRGGVTALKNCCFETDYHEWLLGDSVNILPHLLLPLAGPEELTEEEMEGMPEELQYLEEDKTRETETDIKRMLIEAIMKLCSTKSGRQIVKAKRAYIILREYHKAENDPSLDRPIRDLIQILISDEPEAGQENLNEVQVPDHIAESLEKARVEELASGTE